MKFIFLLCTSLLLIDDTSSTIIKRESENPIESYLPQKEDADEFARIDGNYKELYYKELYKNKFGDIYDWQFPSESVPHDYLGYIQRPNSEIRHIKRTDRQIVYDAIYRFDEYHRRIFPLPIDKSKKRFLILFGCSFTYGNGLNDHETLGHFLTKLSDRYYAYNYAIGGSAPNMMLARLEKTDLRQEIPFEKGAFVYVYLADHLHRANGFMQQLSWMANTPYYEWKGNELEYKSRLGEANPVRSSYFNFLRDQLQINKWFNLNYPKVGKEHVLYTCRLISQSQKEFKRQFPDSAFLVVSHPSGGLQGDLQDCLKSENVPFLQTNKTYWGKDYYIPNDGHPTALTNKQLSEEILQHLEQILP